MNKRTTLSAFWACLLAFSIDIRVQGFVPTQRAIRSDRISRAVVETPRTALCYSLTKPLVYEASSTVTSFLKPSIGSSKATSSSIETDSSVAALPFVIDRLPEEVGEQVYKEISEMCINAFFNDGATLDRKIPIWKEWQLMYLRNLQRNDLRIRRKRYPNTNMMFVARQVFPATDSSMVQQAPLVLDLGRVYNLSPKEKVAGVDYVEGDVLGFVEVTLRPYGLSSEVVGYDEETWTRFRKNQRYNKRPILTNLSVKYEARKSGVGSRLMELCEAQVQQDWSRKEIILEVEDDNFNALKFYEKRGFKELFEDPAGRRYDTNGLLLRQLRCCRKVMRKDLNAPLLGMGSEWGEGEGNMAHMAVRALQRIRESLFSVRS